MYLGQVESSTPTPRGRPHLGSLHTQKSKREESGYAALVPVRPSAAANEQAHR